MEEVLTRLHPLLARCWLLMVAEGGSDISFNSKSYLPGALGRKRVQREKKDNNRERESDVGE